MAKEFFKYACGHDGEADLIGKYKDRELKLEWLKTLNCDHCQGKIDIEKAKERGDELKTVHYSAYKNDYDNCKTVSGSYNPDKKTIMVIIPNLDGKVNDIDQKLGAVKSGDIEALEAAFQGDGMRYVGGWMDFCEKCKTRDEYAARKTRVLGHIDAWMACSHDEKIQLLKYAKCWKYPKIGERMWMLILEWLRGNQKMGSDGNG